MSNGELSWFEDLVVNHFGIVLLVTVLSIILLLSVGHHVIELIKENPNINTTYGLDGVSPINYCLTITIALIFWLIAYIISLTSKPEERKE